MLGLRRGARIKQRCPTPEEGCLSATLRTLMRCRAVVRGDRRVVTMRPKSSTEQAPPVHRPETGRCYFAGPRPRDRNRGPAAAQTAYADQTAGREPSSPRRSSR
ncbi:hypothetical protein MTO96_009766 [Rhipicephalus appendiculatus]